MKSCFFIFLFFLSLNCFSQVTISGKVIDEKTNKGIAGASVYLNNSSCGTQTDTAGNFKLSCTVLGKAEMVFSHVAYEKKIEVIEQDKLENLTITLSERPNTLNEVVIRSKQSKADQSNWMNVFLQNFIGNYSSSSRQCKIKNPEVLYFDFDRQENKLNAYAREALLIENTYIGYKIRLDLDKFEYSFNTNQVQCVYSSFYTDLPQRDTTKAAQIKENRRSYYYGSNMHFMRSIYKNKAVSEGFWLYKYSAVQNQEKLRVNRIIRKKTAEAYAKGLEPLILLNQFFSKDTLKYYDGVMNYQNDMIKIDTVPIGVTKLTTKNRISRTVNFNFQDTLLVCYDKNFPRPLPGVKIQVNVKKTASLIVLSTCMIIIKEGGVNIHQNGYYPESSLFLLGDMADRRLAWALPYDYDPDNP